MIGTFFVVVVSVFGWVNNEAFKFTVGVKGMLLVAPPGCA
jgi:hypothetical protein